MQIPDEMLKEIRESGYDQELIYNYIRELLDSDKESKENNNLELIENYLLDKRFMRELEDEGYDANTGSEVGKARVASSGSSKGFTKKQLMIIDFI